MLEAPSRAGSGLLDRWYTPAPRHGQPGHEAGVRIGKNGTLQRAKLSEYDEFYTQRSDIEKEVRHYTRHFRGKVVYAP